jgi:hypothetical protein
MFRGPVLAVDVTSQARTVRSSAWLAASRWCACSRVFVCGHLRHQCAPMVESVEQSRQLLRGFEAQLPALRAGLVPGNG